MNESQKERVERLTKEVRGLHACERKRMLEKELEGLKTVKKSTNPNLNITVKHNGKVVGSLDFSTEESSWFFTDMKNAKTEVGFTYQEARQWAALNGFRLKVEK